MAPRRKPTTRRHAMEEQTTDRRTAWVVVSLGRASTPGMAAVSTMNWRVKTPRAERARTAAIVRDGEGVRRGRGLWLLAARVPLCCPRERRAGGVAHGF